MKPRLINILLEYGEDEEWSEFVEIPVSSLISNSIEKTKQNLIDNHNEMIKRYKRRKK